MSKHYTLQEEALCVCVQTTITAKNKVSDVCQEKSVWKHDRNSVDT